MESVCAGPTIEFMFGTRERLHAKKRNLWPRLWSLVRSVVHAATFSLNAAVPAEQSAAFPTRFFDMAPSRHMLIVVVVSMSMVAGSLLSGFQLGPAHLLSPCPRLFLHINIGVLGSNLHFPDWPELSAFLK